MCPNPLNSENKEQPSRRDFLADLLRGGAAAGLASLAGELFESTGTQRTAVPGASRQLHTEPHPHALAFVSGRPVQAGADNPFASTSTEAILGKLAKAEPAHAKQLLSILANSKIHSDPPIEKLEPFLKHKDGEIVAAALEILAKRDSMKIDHAFLKPHLADTRERVRLAVIDLLAHRKDLSVDAAKLEELHKLAPRGRVAAALHYDAILDLVAFRDPEGAKDYLREHHGVAKEKEPNRGVVEAKERNFAKLDELELVRAAGQLAPQALLLGGEIRIGRTLLKRVDRAGRAAVDAMPMLHLLRSIDAEYPGYLDKVNEEKGRLAALSKELLACVRAEREAEIDASRELMKRDVNVLVGLHDEFSSWPERTEKRVRELMHPARIKSCEVIFPPIEDGVKSPKADHLKKLGAIAAESGSLALVWHTGHGGPRHYWFLAGGIGEHLSENLNHESGVSHQEVAKALLSGFAKGKADLSHVVLIQDACFQLDFVMNLYEALFDEAKTRGIELAGMPRLVSASQRGLPSWLARSFEGQIAEDAEKKLEFTIREPGSFIQNAFRESNRKKGTFLERILLADEMLNGELDKELDKPDASLEGQDMAIFSARVLDLAKLIGGVGEDLAKRKIALPELPPRREGKPAPGVMQIADRRGARESSGLA